MIEVKAETQAQEAPGKKREKSKSLITPVPSLTPSSTGLELETPSLVTVKKNTSAVVVSDKHNLKPVPLKCQHNTQRHQRDLSEDHPATANESLGFLVCSIHFLFQASKSRRRRCCHPQLPSQAHLKGK